MLKDFLKVWLDIEEVGRGQEEVFKKIEEVEEELDALKEGQVSEDRVRQLEKELRELTPVTVDLTDRERDILEILMSLDGFASTTRIAEELGVSSANARAIIGNLTDKVDIDVKKEGRKKVYRLSKEEKEKIFSQR